VSTPHRNHPNVSRRSLLKGTLVGGAAIAAPAFVRSGRPALTHGASPGRFPPDKVDTTFGAQQVFVKAPAVGNAAPSTEFQFFGQVSISAETRALTVHLRDNSGAVLRTKDLPAHRR
jgi:hypothetical protein